ncbi:alpha/beta hydrolase [Taklimakanibacter deserti]|uniref:alpha/beta hydrolase n=1 Tax=Taklimakanibacter deserti TaxID=2267839 RepID=UPI000E659C7D
MSRRDSLRLDWRRDNIRFLRAHYEQACRAPPKGAHEWLSLDVGGRLIRLLIHDAAAPSDRAIIYFHGGGWIVGSPSTHADITSALAATTGLPVISVDYRLAPEFVAEDMISDGLAVLRHFLGRYESAILCGDSAGGALALAVECNAGELKEDIIGVASFYGCFGLWANAALHQASAVSDGLDTLSVRRYWQAANRSQGLSPYSIPALAHAQGCPVHLLIAGRDPLCRDSLALANALKEKGRPVTIDMQAFADHSFLQDPRLHRARENAYRGIADWICALNSARPEARHRRRSSGR